MDPEKDTIGGEPAAGKALEMPDSVNSHLSLDWTQVPAEKKEKRPEYGPEYDSRPLEDKARRQIAYLLIALLAGVILAIIVMLCFKVIKVDEIKEFSVLLGPLITLVSAATGFYYGTSQSNSHTAAQIGFGRMSKRKPYWEKNDKELARANRKFDDPAYDPAAIKPSAKQLEQLESWRGKRKSGPQRVAGNGFPDKPAK